MCMPRGLPARCRAGRWLPPLQRRDDDPLAAPAATMATFVQKTTRVRTSTTDDAMFYAGELSRATADRYLDPATLCGQSPGTRRPRIGPLPVEPPPVIVDSGRGDRHNPPPSPGHHRRSAVHDGPLARQAGRLESVPRKGRTASVKQTHAPLRATRAGSSDDPASRGRTTLPNEREDGIDIDGFDQVVLESRL